MSASMTSRAHAYGRPSSAASRGRAGSSFAAGYRGARYVPTSVAEKLPLYDEPSIAVVPGAGRRAQAQEGLSAAALTLAKVCAVACIALALIAVARVAITSAAATCALETREISQSIEEARAQGNELEVAQSVLSNPTRIKTQAQAMGMMAPTPAYSEQLVLPRDIVATDEAGNLSLSESTAALAAR
ncbi:cell division protein FtsL [Adlercreutzia sp. R21]|uniref:cell division protein FtsL n=1 Tax=Adlercreutzia wanghongyangiae TaxID=3111451 RepID=UPI002DB7D976|nr:cell division protein FtsL [Adlercreutzia sp. R21]MEC4184615.1 cell division protein FtsL [Adlercreutzia sp. R21]